MTLSLPRSARALLVALGAAVLAAAPLFAEQAAPAPAAPATATAGAALDPVAATDAYLATVSGPARAKSDAYFEGGYWLQLWDFLLGVGLNLALLGSGISRRMQAFSERLTRFRPLQTLLYWCQYLLLVTVVLFPMTIYEGFAREHKYGLANQTFGPWLSDQAKGLGVGLLFGGLAMMALYGVARRLPKTWALWGAVASMLILIVGVVIAPVYIRPLFNAFTRLEDPVVGPGILKMARAQGVPAKDVYVYDASKQTKRVSADVSGFASTMRISLNDNLLHRSSLAEIEAVMGHEMGHYVLHHVYKTTLFFGVVLVVGFALVKWAFDRIVARRGRAWGIGGIGDTAALPLVATLLTVWFTLLTPVLNSWTRVEEAEADLFGINASGQPDGEALCDLKLGEYRKLDPSPLEELIFFDHPSGRNRILMAMRWKAEHPAEAAANAKRAAEDDARRGFDEASAAKWAKEHEPK